MVCFSLPQLRNSAFGPSFVVRIDGIRSGRNDQDPGQHDSVTVVGMTDSSMTLARQCVSATLGDLIENQRAVDLQRIAHEAHRY